MSFATKIIAAYDKSTFDKADQQLLKDIAPFIDGVKVGLEAMNAEGEGGYPVSTLVSSFVTDILDKEVMWDGKFADIGNTMTKAVRNLVTTRLGVTMFTLHASISDNALRAVAQAVEGTNALPLAVTVLTDIDEEQCQSRFGDTPRNTVLRFAQMTQKCNIRGLVCSPQELNFLHENTALRGVTTVIPGIRPAWAAAGDQKRIMTPADAARAGASYLVVGRPIFSPPKEVGHPADAARLIREELDQALVPA